VVADDRHDHIMLRVRGGATGVWTAEVLFDRIGTIYLTNSWRRFCPVHEIMAIHLLLFNYNEEHTLTVTVFDETMCQHHYTHVTLANTAASSFSSDQ
jgi:hypothetical protein